MILGEAKYSKIVPEIDGCLPAAALAAFMDVKFGLNMGIDKIIYILYIGLALSMWMWAIPMAYG